VCAGGSAAGDNAYADDAFVWPSWNAVVAAGHNIEARMAPELRSSNDGFGATTC
jgi:hypothetical protein